MTDSRGSSGEEATESGAWEWLDWFGVVVAIATAAAIIALTIGSTVNEDRPPPPPGIATDRP